MLQNWTALENQTDRGPANPWVGPSNIQAGTVGKLKRPNGKTMHKSTAPPGDSGTSVLFPEEVAERQGKTDVWPHRSSH